MFDDASYTISSNAFRPVRCKETDLKDRTPVEGFVYFTTDTKKIFCGFNGAFVPMGGNSGIYYGQRKFSEDETNTEEINFKFSTENEIEGDQTPIVDDLILNIPDGCFYRVIDVYGDEITGQRLTVTGSGGPGTGPSSSLPSIIDHEGGIRYFVADDTENMKINFSCSTQNDIGNYIAMVTYTFGQEVIIEEVNYAFGANISFDVSKYLNKFSTSSRNTLQVQVTDVFGNASMKKSFYFYLIELTLESDASAISVVTKNDTLPYIYPCTPKGGSGLENLYIELTVSPLDNSNLILYSTQRAITNVNTSYSFQIDFSTIDDISHGVYLLTAKFCGIIPNTTKVIASNVAAAQIAYYDTNVGTPLIATNFTGATIQQYSQFNMQYMIVDENTVSEVEALIYYGNNYSTEIATLNELNIWSRMFIETGIYEIAIQYKGNKYSIGTLQVQQYAGDIPVIDSAEAELYLTALGKSNTQADKEIWEWKGHRAQFDNFLWGSENGWITNEKNETALKISNGAKLTLPTYHPFTTEATTNGLTIELDFMFSGVLDYSKPLIHCLSTYVNDGVENIQTGFHITGQKATLNSSINKATSMIIGGEEDESGNINEQDMALQAFTQYFNEDTRIHLTYVISRVPSDWTQISDTNFYFVYTYLNGVLSGIMQLKVDKDNRTSESFKDYANSPSVITFDSTYGDIYLYNIRVYRSALDMRTIINNYIADLTDIEEKIALYKDNNIFDTNGFISLNAIQDISYTLGVPYVLLKGGCVMEKKFQDGLTFNPSYRLPLTKSDYRLMSMKMYEPDLSTNTTSLALDIPISVEDNSGNIIDNFENMTSGTSYIPHRGVQVYGQGTSSMVYPVKNLRLKFVDENDYPIVYNGSYPVEIVCFKADFMDSSSAHNTSTSNLIYDLHNKIGLKSPAQAFKYENNGQNGVAEYDLVTSIRGYPIICFYAPGDSDNYTYIGRYNFNLDKATPEPFGFFPQWFYTGNTTTDDNGNLRKEVKACGLKTEIVNNMTVLPINDNGEDIVRDIIQCWEVLNNDNNSPTKFLTPSGYSDYATALNTNWGEWYEDRYPDEMAGMFKGDDPWTPEREEDLVNGLFRMSKWINSTATKEATNANLNEPVYYRTVDESYNANKQYYSSTASGFEPIIIVEEDKISIANGETVEDSLLANLSIDLITFANKVNSEHADYTFTYLEGAWYVNGISAIMSEYGIGYTGTPADGDSLKVAYHKTNNWSTNLYEQFLTDSAEYRLAKFKAEFTDYFDMDFSLFYYCLTMVLLMMDSRAKNMMLASWDQTIWYPIFYDMDTMLGVNNTGFNKFSYDTEDDPADKVFNGFDSVLWNNFRDCFYDEIAEFYVNMRTHGLDYNNLMLMYNEKGADAWNEALCSADAIYKYERPYKEGYYDGAEGTTISPGQISYLYAGQGKRSNHRAWWLENRFNYLDSKYYPEIYGSQKPSQSNTFAFRAYALPEQKSTTAALECVAQVPPSHKFEFTALNNSYQSVMMGNTVYGPVYTLANQNVTLGPDDVRHEVESYILNPTLIADLGDLSNKYIGQLNFPGVETRLTELKLGRSSRSHPDTYDKYYNKLLSALNLGTACPYLNAINIARCTGLQSVDLTKCTRLQVVDAEGCSVKDISFPANSILREIYVPDTLTSLTLTNQPYLETIKFDTSAKGLTSIVLDRVSNMNTYDLVKSVYDITENTAKMFYLTDINWIVADMQNGIDENGVLRSIDILETLLSDRAYTRDNYNKAQSLTGTITLNIDNCKVDEYEIYVRYRTAFPNVTILYGDKMIVDPAVKITFMNDDSDTAFVHYEVLASGDTAGPNAIKLSELTSINGPTGVALTTPNKPSSESHDYLFTGYWKDQNNILYYDSSVIDPEDEALNLDDIVPTKDLTLYPQYSAQDRYYSVKFYDWDGNVILQNGQVEFPVKWNNMYNGPIKNYYYRDSSSLDTYERWGFQGWSTINYGDNIVVNPVYINPLELKVTNSIVLYAHYIKENVTSVATKEEYFNIVGNAINIKDEYRETLAGKITLPTINGVTAIGDFKNLTNVTHVFFLTNANYTTVNDEAFQIAANSNIISKIEMIDLPATIRTIGASAFQGLRAMHTITLNDSITSIGQYAFHSQSTSESMKVVIQGLPSSLIYLGQSAFWHAGPNIIISNLPIGISYLPSHCFTFCENVKISEFGSNDSNGSRLMEIGTQCFYSAGTGNIGPDVTSIIFNNTVTAIQPNAFSGYAKNTLTNVYFARSESEYNTDASQMGFTGVNITYSYEG